MAMVSSCVVGISFFFCFSSVLSFLQAEKIIIKSPINNRLSFVYFCFKTSRFRLRSRKNQLPGIPNEIRQ